MTLDEALLSLRYLSARLPKFCGSCAYWIDSKCPPGQGPCEMRSRTGTVWVSKDRPACAAYKEFRYGPA